MSLQPACWKFPPVLLLILVAIAVVYYYRTSQPGSEKDTSPSVPTWSSAMIATSQSGSEKCTFPVAPTWSFAMKSTTLWSGSEKENTWNHSARSIFVKFWNHTYQERPLPNYNKLHVFTTNPTISLIWQLSLNSEKQTTRRRMLL